MRIDAETIQALLQAAKQSPPSRVEKPGEVTPFDFQAPHRFAPEAAKRLREAAEVMARDLTATLSAALQGAFPIALDELKELYISHLPAVPDAYYVPLNINEHVAGFLLLPRDTAVGWVTKLLGGLADGDIEDGRILSTLETDLLLDVTKKVVEAVSRACRDNDGPTITHTEAVSRAPVELVEEGQIADVCYFTFQRKEGDKALPFFLVLLSELLEPMAGMVRPPERSLEDVQRDMLAHVESVPTDVNVRLGTVNVSMRDLASLEVGDVILLSRPMGEPIDVIVSGKTIMAGQPVQHKGWYGLQILRVKEDA
ncbi:MAG: FliM/FliN family flagellar motor switch protein [Phycisphaerae bacterium]|nr:FliM/FliN family flagellar motor switch protein [Phycisphaerae bacterium]